MMVYWDLDEEADDNVQHIAQHGVTKDEVVESWRTQRIPTPAIRRAGRWRSGTPARQVPVGGLR